MPSNRIMFALHGFALVLALATALAWPRAGEPVLLVPLGPGGTAAAIAWADRTKADFLAIRPDRGRIIARVPSNDSLLSAMAAGILPIAVSTRGCTQAADGRRMTWKS